ncbi:MAG TPA: efflux RND transporter periplasmic adaptor subunit, partial [Chitinophagaceae bacterium]|nr:efflux RND transporter periplasmic adaptor subunit [Chitinophagaceae bacterium]
MITFLINSFKYFGRVSLVYLPLLIACSLLLIFSSCKGGNKDSEQTSNIFYTCSMHPQIMEPAPGTCPICGMDLIPVEKRTGADEDAIVLSDQQIQLGNIHADTIGKGEIGSETVLTATLNVDETKTATVSARIAGRIEKLYYKNEGDYIQKGTKLYDLYSEELNNAKQEYLLALEKQKALD